MSWWKRKPRLCDIEILSGQASLFGDLDLSNEAAVKALKDLIRDIERQVQEKP